MTDVIPELGIKAEVMKPVRHTLSGAPLRMDWPQFASDSEVQACYHAPNPDAKTPFGRFSFTLRNGAKELSYAAVEHSDDPNDPQMAGLVSELRNFKPGILLYEGQEHPFPKTIETTDEAVRLDGERGLVRHCANMINQQDASGSPILVESGDISNEAWVEEFKKIGFTQNDVKAYDKARRDFFEVQMLNPKAHSTYLDDPKMKQMFDAELFRDRYQLRRIIKSLHDHDRVMIVMGSGHAIRQRKALEEYFQ